MKRLLLAVTMLALVLPAAREAEALSVDFFYENLGDGGSWVEVGDYGYCWQPTVAVSNRSWRPYSDGYWAYTDLGWTWVSYEDFGWATYHYGRWMRLRGRGWVWVPGREWGPAWVSWRTGGDYVGWAPLPPRRAGEYWDESPITSRVDIDFDIGPAYYNFIDIRYIGEPVLRERIFAPEENVTYITRTVNVTNITYRDSRVYNSGPDYDTISRYSTRPIQRLSLQQETIVDPATAVRSKTLMKVEGDKLVVAAPQKLEKPAASVVPKVVKEKIASTPVERGWEPVGDQKAQTELKEKMKKEDPKAIPPPTVQASDKAETSPGATAPASAGATAPPAAAASSAPSPAREKGKNKRDEKAAPSMSVPPASVPSATIPSDKNKGKNKQRDNVAPSASVPPSSSVTEKTAPSAASKPPKDKSTKPKKDSAVTPPLPAPKSFPRVAPPPGPEAKPQPAPDSIKPEAAAEKSKHNAPADVPAKPKKDIAPDRVAPPPPATAPANPPPDEGKKKKKDQPEPGPKP